MKAFGENSPTFPHHQPSTPSPPLQLAIESRVTSDDLQLAVSATDDKIVAVQSAVDSALSDRFRRMQDVVHEQARVYRGSGGLENLALEYWYPLCFFSCQVEFLS